MSFEIDYVGSFIRLDCDVLISVQHIVRIDAVRDLDNSHIIISLTIDKPLIIKCSSSTIDEKLRNLTTAINKAKR